MFGMCSPEIAINSSGSLHKYATGPEKGSYKSKCLVQRLECATVTPSPRVEIQLDEVFLYF